MSALRLGWFSTGRGAGSFAMLSRTITAIEQGDLNAQIAVLFSNRDRGEAEPTERLFDYAEGHGIPVVAFSSVAFRKAHGGERSKPGEALPAWRDDYDQALAAALARHPFDLGILAGYMLITTPDFCNRYPLLNLHPAAPGGPVGTWQEVIHNLIAKQATESGISIHVVTPELDKGPVATFCRYPVMTAETAPLWESIHLSPQEIGERGEETPLFAAIRRYGQIREGPLLLATLKAAAAHCFRVEPGIVRNTEGRPARPLDLSEDVEAALREAPCG